MSELFDIGVAPKVPNLHFGNMHGLEDGTDEHLTPPDILLALDTANKFDLDPCASVVRPWPVAKHHFTVVDDGLKQGWFGRVWMNPPYGEGLPIWMRRLAEYGDGIALTFARTETKAFFPWVWDHADAIMFLRKRLTFYKVDGTPHVSKKTGKPSNAGCPSVLIAYGRRNVEALAESHIEGRLVILK